MLYFSANAKKLVSFIAAGGWAKYHTAMNLGMPEMIFIFVLALLLFGPKKLPQMGRELGKALSEFKRASNEFKNQLETEIAKVEATEQEKAVPAPASTEFSADPMQQPIPQPVTGETVEPRILPPSERTVATTFGQAVEAEPSSPEPLVAASGSPPRTFAHGGVEDPTHDSNLAPSNLAAVQGENAGSINLNKAQLRESNA
jgi:TatA/E family protein of Tat protein translocase